MEDATATGPPRQSDAVTRDESDVPTRDRERSHTAVGAAIEFVAMRPDVGARILARHYALGNGICAGCAASATRHPCLVQRIAVLARRLPTPPTDEGR